MQNGFPYQKYTKASVQVIASTPFLQTGDEAILNTTAVRISNGFLIRDGYVITTAQTVLAPPSLSSGALPAYAYNAAPPDGVMRNLPLPASSITVTVNGMADDLLSMQKKAVLIGASGSDDIAVLQLAPENSGWNYGTGSILGIESTGNGCKYVFNCFNDSCVKSYPFHEYLHLGLTAKSICNMFPEPCSEVGIPSSIITNNGGRWGFHGGPPVCFKGQVVNSFFTDGSGLFLPESLLVAADLPQTLYGQAVINSEGKVLGMISGSYTGDFLYSDAQRSDLFIGPNFETLQRVVSAIIHSQSCGGKDKPRDVLIYKYQGLQYTAFRQAYIGIGYEVNEGGYEFLEDYTSGASPYPALNTTAVNGAFVGNGPKIKAITGLRLLGVAGLNPDNTNGQAGGSRFILGGVSTAPLIPGTADVEGIITNENISAPNPIGVSPLLGTDIKPGDIITQIGITGGCQYNLGQRACEHNLSSFLKLTASVGDRVTITYVSVPLDGTDNNTEVHTEEITLTDTPAAVAFPWAFVGRNWDGFANQLDMTVFPATQLYPGNSVIGGDGPFLPQRVNPASVGRFWPSL
uniref:Uncharacterized protein n=1 Tax=viral metagenome TaxID=1070528 RepID=A0A6C0JXT5_9ZZZZ